MATVAAPAAWGQSASPTPSRGPIVSGQVTGATAAGSSLAISVDATMAGGWEALHLVEASVVSGDRQLEHLRFDIEDNKLTVGDQDIAVGTGAVATGEYLRVSGADVIITTGGANLSLRVNSDVVKAIPGDARFVLSVTDDVGGTATTTRRLAEPEGGGLSWGDVATAVLLALLAGGFVGNIFATRRRPAPRMSVYDSIQRRLDDERRSSQGRTA
jgi:hypothetical protein